MSPAAQEMHCYQLVSPGRLSRAFVFSVVTQTPDLWNPFVFFWADCTGINFTFGRQVTSTHKCGRPEELDGWDQGCVYSWSLCFPLWPTYLGSVALLPGEARKIASACVCTPSGFWQACCQPSDEFKVCAPWDPETRSPWAGWVFPSLPQHRQVIATALQSTCVED